MSLSSTFWKHNNRAVLDICDLGDNGYDHEKVEKHEKNNRHDISKNIFILKSAQMQMHLKSRGKNEFNVFVFQMYLLL